MGDAARFKPKTLWVFGYGSLVWHPGFEYKNFRIGKIRGYSRRFWQGSTVHRGTPEKPGRVVTLVEDVTEVTWGKAYELGDESSLPSLEYLNVRESKLGGYKTQIVVFEPEDEKEDPFPVLIYIATADNDLYAGPGKPCDLATQIAGCAGSSGHNAEYLLRLADFMHDHVPHAMDEHLFTLEALVRSRLKEQKLSVGQVMGDGGDRDLHGRQDGGGNHHQPNAAEAPRPTNFQFTATIPAKKLRCLNV